MTPIRAAIARLPPVEMLSRNVSVLISSPEREERETYLSRYLVTGQATIVGVGRQSSAGAVTGRRFLCIFRLAR